MVPQAAVAAGARAMGKHYFCDYCNRSFQDNLHNRKKHLNGLQHLKAKKVWYDMFRGECWLATAGPVEASLPIFLTGRQGSTMGQRQSWSGLLEEPRRGGWGHRALGADGLASGQAGM